MHTSKYSNRKVTDGQYIAELCCERKAAKEGVKLWKQFWNDKTWNNFFKRQCNLANKLLKIYSFGCIIQGMSKVKWAWSLATPSLISEIEKIGNSEEIKKETEVIEVTEKATKRTEVKKGLFEIL